MLANRRALPQHQQPPRATEPPPQLDRSQVLRAGLESLVHLRELGEGGGQVPNSQGGALHSDRTKVSEFNTNIFAAIKCILICPLYNWLAQTIFTTIVSLKHDLCPEAGSPCEGCRFPAAHSGFQAESVSAPTEGGLCALDTDVTPLS